jgi:hypothetical protein
MYSIGPKHIIVPAPDTNIEVNGNPEGVFAAGSTIDVQLTNTTPTTISPNISVVGNVVGLEIIDTDYDIYVNGLFNTTVSLPTLDTNTININIS